MIPDESVKNNDLTSSEVPHIFPESTRTLMFSVPDNIPMPTYTIQYNILMLKCLGFMALNLCIHPKRS